MIICSAWYLLRSKNLTDSQTSKRRPPEVKLHSLGLVHFSQQCKWQFVFCAERLVTALLNLYMVWLIHYQDLVCIHHRSSVYLTWSGIVICLMCLQSYQPMFLC